MAEIEFKKGADSVIVNTPQYGYSSEIHMSMKRGEQLANGEYPWFDNGKEYDIRFFIADFILNATQQKNLQKFFYDDARDPGSNGIQMKVPAGIYPFGPDRGCGERRFMVKLVESNFTGAEKTPWLHFKSQLKFSLMKKPLYNIPDQEKKEKAISIGNVDNLRYPQEGYAPETVYGINNIVTYGGNVHGIDKKTDGDWHVTKFILTENANKMAQLINYIQRTIRDNSFSVKVQKNSFLFGRLPVDEAFKEGAGTYTVVLTDNVLKVQHQKLHQFSIELGLFMKEYVP